MVNPTRRKKGKSEEKGHNNFIEDSSMTATRRKDYGSSFKKEGESNAGDESTKLPKELSLKRFMELNPELFFGTETSEKAEDWLLNIERLFKNFQCSDNCKVRLAVHQLKGDGYKWWLGARLGLESQYSAVSWDKFKSAFLGFYFPKAVRDAKYTELKNLRQENLTVYEYARKFSSLFYYAPPSIQNSEMAKNLQFREGLRPEIATLLVNQADSYVELRDMAMSIEAGLMAMNRSLSSARSSGANSTLSSAHKFPLKKTKQRTLLRACFACGQMGHIARNCPQRD